MADTTRQKILDDIQTTIEGIARIKSVITNRLTLPDFNINPMPIAFVFSGDEKDATKEFGVINYESWRWEVLIMVWTQDEDIEDYVGLVHNAMGADETRGGHALFSKRVSGIAPYAVDPEGSIMGVELIYEIQYRHIEGIA
jgi:hypothetical protein